jgi:hypothetical protein
MRFKRYSRWEPYEITPPKPAAARQLFGRRKIDTLCSLSFSNIKTAEERVGAIACEREHWWQRMRDFDPPDRVGICDTSQTLFCFRMSLREDRNWATKIYQERAEAIDANENVTYFFLKNYQEICRYMRTIGYGSKGKAETVEKQVAGELEIGRYCSLRTTVRGRQSTQDIALFIYRDLNADFLGSGLVVVTFDTSGELAKEFADAWFQKADAFMKESLSNNEDN